MKDKLINLLKILGPGIIFASICIGETHLALIPYAGALYGFALLWMIVFVHLVYYPIFEYGSRYAVATGEALFDGYKKTKAGRFFIWVGLVVSFIVAPLYMASLLGLTGSVLYAAFPAVDFRIWCVLFYVLTVALVLGNKYKAIEGISKILVLIIVLTAAIAFIISPPPAGDFFSGLIPSIPAVAGVMIVVVAILRVPTDPSVSIFISEWAKEKRLEWLSGKSEKEEKQVLLEPLRKSIFDMRIGMLLSCIVGIIFLSVGATVLKPSGIIPKGVAVALKLSEMYTQTIGRWIFPLFLLCMFAAFWGGYVAAMDGIYRIWRKIIQLLFNPEEKKLKTFGVLYLLLVTTVGLLMATIIQRPMFMVLLAVSISLINYPGTYAMVIYCNVKLIDKKFRPGKLNLTLATLGFCTGVFGLILMILVRVLKVIQ